MKKRAAKSKPVVPQPPVAKSELAAKWKTEIKPSAPSGCGKPTPAELAKLAIEMAGGQDASQFMDAALVAWEAAHTRIEQRAAQRAQLEATSFDRARTRWLFMQSFLHKPVKFADLVSWRLLPKTLGKKGVAFGAQPFLTSEKGIEKSLREFFQKCRPIPTQAGVMAPNLSYEARFQPSQDFLTQILRQRELPYDLFRRFRDWRSSPEDRQGRE